MRPRRKPPYGNRPSTMTSLKRCLVTAVLLSVVSASNGQHLPGAMMQPGALPNNLAAEMPLLAQADLDGRAKSAAGVLFDAPADTLVDPRGLPLLHAHHRPQCVGALACGRRALADVCTWVAEGCGGRLSVAVLMSALGCGAVVMCGVLPALWMPIDVGAALHCPAGTRKLNLMLSFAVGSLIGDVFLHILPETWASDKSNAASTGVWVIGGLLLCFLAEKFCSKSEESQHKVTAIVNLLANIVDNFTHGLAVGGSFLVNIRFGLLTTFAILIHEIPHEISDFAILLRADFDRWSAIKAQLVTALAGVAGAAVAIASAGSFVGGANWILPFTAGGFLNIALVQVLPDLIKETNTRESLKQLSLMGFGVVVMGVLNAFQLA